MIYSTENFPYNDFSKITVQKRRRGNQSTLNRFKYLNVISAFDIETTNDDKSQQAFMYIWQMQIGSWTVVGRYWSEWIEFMQKLKNCMDENVYLVIFVHNLSFEFQFLRGLYPFEVKEVFATDSRKVLKCEMYEHFEFRCSYLQTNMSLAEFTKKMGVEHSKLSGEEFDYRKQRYPWTRLSKRELEYCVNDVRGLCEAMKVQMSLDHDNFYTLPLTSTGYVRRDVKKAMRSYNYQDLHKQLPDYEVFKILREAFRGGNTHANRYYTEDIIKNVQSYDRVSSYPDVQLNHLFPMTAWVKEDREYITKDRVIRIMTKHKRACLMRCRFLNIRLANHLTGCPYIPKAKCRNLVNPEVDNGRILSASSLDISLTDIDLRIILDQYIFTKVQFTDFYHARYGKLPKQLRETIKHYFVLKTNLKNVKGQELYYGKAKGRLNAVYGMSVQSPVKCSIDFIWDDEEKKEVFKVREQSEEELLEKSNHKAFQNYAWGVWVSAWARYELQRAINLCGDDFVYCDTDSVKFCGKVDFTEYNKEQRKKSRENGSYAKDPNGKIHYLGVFEKDADYKEFITMGAKKYAYMYKDGSIGITVAGVGKTKGSKELSERGGLKSFKDGFVFKEAGGTESLYNDIPYGKCMYINRKGRDIKITSNVYIRDSEYTLGLAPEYKRILNKVQLWKEVMILQK